jgi:adenosylcobinamide hydrolase
VGTAADMDNLAVVTKQFGPFTVTALVTAGAKSNALRAVVTITEAKTAALEDLKVPSSYTKGAQATGTGTDSVIVVSGSNGPKVTYSGGHSRIGDLISKAVHQAVLEALKKQNGFRRNLTTPNPS